MGSQYKEDCPFCPDLARRMNRDAGKRESAKQVEQVSAELRRFWVGHFGSDTKGG